MNPLLQQYLIGISLVYLMTRPFLGGVLNAYNPMFDYYRTAPTGSMPLLAGAICMLCGAGLYAFLSRLVLLRPRGQERVEYFQAVALAAFLPTLAIYSRPLGFNIFMVAQVALMVWALNKRGARLRGLTTKAMMLFSALVLVLLATAVWQAQGGAEAGVVHSSPREADKTSSAAGGRRLVWVIFDELDYRIAVDRRPAGIELPELDRLLAQAVVGRQTKAAGAWTRDIIPALLTGEPIESVREKSAGELRITPASTGQEVDFSSKVNLFQKARAGGIRTAVTGWYHPYCRLIGDDTDSCAWQPAPDARDSVRAQWAAELDGPQATFMALLQAPLRTAFAQAERKQILHELNLVRRQHLDAFRAIHENALRQAADPSYQLVFLHYNIPHPFGIFDRKTREYSLSDSTDYVDNLVLMDRVIGEIRGSLDANTSLLVMSDHSFRPYVWDYRPTWSKEMAELTAGGQDFRTVFALHMAGQEAPVSYETPFNAIVAHTLALEIALGRMRSAEDATAWIDAHR